MNPRINFYTDYDLDCINCFVRLRKHDPAGLEYRVKSKGLDLNLVKRVVESDEGDGFEVWKKYYQLQLNHRISDIEDKLTRYRQIWSGIDRNFVEIVNQRFDSMSWNYEQYDILVGIFYSQASWGKSNKLGISALRDPDESYHFPGYELMLTHTFEAVDQFYEIRPCNDWYVWALAEITAAILVYCDLDMVESLWPSVKEKCTNNERLFQTGSYPHLRDPFVRLKPIWDGRDDFKDYVFSSLEVLQEFSLAQIKGSN
ncbi:hypothetical protein KC614_00165 [candidate division WWE3 bacterium]|uniref:Uncharacterized protein n=1 Tax=candidate division WWE3 bacterium TaxID=2053526 RepID=A0A955RRK4_UNCKA|nr:hypothetical protein [candidate division WWE3 bacterium]